MNETVHLTCFEFEGGWFVRTTQVPSSSGNLMQAFSHRNQCRRASDWGGNLVGGRQGQVSLQLWTRRGNAPPPFVPWYNGKAPPQTSLHGDGILPPRTSLHRGLRPHGALAPHSHIFSRAPDSSSQETSPRTCERSTCRIITTISILVITLNSTIDSWRRQIQLLVSCLGRRRCMVVDITIGVASFTLCLYDTRR